MDLVDSSPPTSWPVGSLPVSHGTPTVVTTGLMFGNRFVQQAKINREKWWTKKGHPTRRHLALIMWAYSPTPRRVADWLRSVQ